MANEKIIFDTEVKVGNSVGSVKSLKAELRAITNELGQLEVGSEAFVKAAQKAGELQDRIGDVKNTVAAFNPEAKFQALAGAVGIAANGFSAMQGAMALMGSESEDLNKIIAQTQGAIALATGLNGLLGMKDAFVLLKLQAVTSFTAIKAAAVTTFTTIKGAILATGIGALVVALGIAINEILKYNEAVDEESNKQKKLNDELEKSADLMDKAANASEKIRNAKKGGLDDLKREKDLLLAKGATEKEVFEQTQKILEKELSNLKTKKYSGLEVSKEIADKENEIKVNQLAFDKKIEDKKKENADKKKEQYKKQAEIEKKLIEDQKKQQEEFIARTEKEYNDTNKFTDEFYKKKELALIKSGGSEEGIKKQQQENDIKQLEQKIQNAKDYGQSTVDFELEIEKKKTAIKNENDKKALEKHNQTLKETSTNTRLSYDERLAAYKQMAAENLITAKELKDAEISIEKEKQAAKRAALQEGANVLNQASELLGKSTEEGKVLAVASATISTYLSAQKAFESFAGIPVVGVGLGIAAAGVAVAAGIANVNKILSTPVPGNSGGGSGGGGISAPSAPRIPQSFSGARIGGNSEVITTNKGEIQKVIVTETDITQTQNKVKGIIRKATIR